MVKTWHQGHPWCGFRRPFLDSKEVVVEWGQVRVGDDLCNGVDGSVAGRLGLEP